MLELARRPWLLTLSLAPLPALITVASMFSQISAAQFWGALVDGQEMAPDVTSPWLLILRPVLAVMLLLGLLVWVTASLPDLPSFQRRTLKLKRNVIRAGSLLIAGTFWLGVVLGDVAWHNALQDLPIVGSPASLQSNLGVYALGILGTAIFVNFLIQPKVMARR